MAPTVTNAKALVIKTAHRLTAAILRRPLRAAREAAVEDARQCVLAAERDLARGREQRLAIGRATEQALRAIREAQALGGAR
jgi:hypothetical protein